VLGCQLRNGTIHHIGADESLPEIAHVYGVDLMDILAANRITDPAYIKPGTRIWIPGGDPQKWAKEETRLAQLGEMKDSSPEPAESPTPVPVVKKEKPKKIDPKEFSGEFIWPAEGSIVSPFGKRNSRMHNGVDIRLVAPGAAVRSTAAGKVVYRGNDVAGYGDLVIIKHRARIFSVYGYLGNISVLKGANVARGDVIATGSLEPAKAFIHFEIRQAKRALDPEQWIKSGLKKK
jgi:lipoprotein NlpD